MGVMGRYTYSTLDWSRVRVGPCRFAFDGFGWLRACDPAALTFAGDEPVTLVHARLAGGGVWHERAPRVDEAQAVLDVQMVVDDLHPVDRRQRHLLRFHLDLPTRILSRQQTKRSVPLDVVVTPQRLGVRHWWSCPVCGRRCRFLYLFEVGAGSGADSVVGCRVCLGLTYASRSRHRCADQDRREADRGGVEATARVRRRLDRAATRRARQEASEAAADRRRRHVWTHALVDLRGA